jgi:hypothetical protein
LHDLAVVLESAADLLHERAAAFLASVPTRGPHDRQRVEWGVALAAGIEAKGHHDEAERVLVAALALSEGLFGRDDPQSVATRKRLVELGAPSEGPASQDGSRARARSPRRETPSFS